MLANNQIRSGTRWTVKSVNGSYDFKIGGKSGTGASECIANDIFNVGGYNWKIIFDPNNTSLFIVLVSNATDVIAWFGLTLLDQSGNREPLVYSCTPPYTLMSRGSKWGDDGFIRRTIPVTSEDYFKDDSLLVRCSVSVVVHFTLFPSLSDMSQNLKYLLETEAACDVVLRVGDKTFKAHKVILAAGSPVFRALFFGLVGNPNNIDEVEFKEVEPAIFKAMLWFIYSDTLPDLQELTGLMSSTSIDIIAQLLAVADRFDVDRLKLLCEIKLGDEVNVDTVAATLAFADKHHCSELKSICLKYASENLEGGAC